MPGKRNKQKRKYNRKSNSNQTGRDSNNGRIVGMPLFVSKDPFPDEWICKLNYSETVTLTSGVTGVTGTEQSFRLNGCFDIDLTGVGHQPYGYDQMALLYGRYIVTGCDIHLEFTDPSADGMFVCAQLQGNAATVNTTNKLYNELAERSNCLCKVLNNTGSQVTRMNFKVPINTLMGVTAEQYSRELSLYGAVISADPTQQVYVRINAGSLRGTSGVSCVCTVKLVQYVKFYDRLTQNQS